MAVTLKKPAGRQKNTPMPVAAAVMSFGKWPSRWKETNPRIGAAKARPVAQAIDVHSKEEKFDPPPVLMVWFVSLLYLQIHHIALLSDVLV